MKLNEVIAKYGNQEVDESKIKEVLGVKESKIWKPKDDERFYVVAGYGLILSGTSSSMDFLEAYLDVGNCYKTLEEAEFARDKQIFLTKFERYLRENEDEPVDYSNQQQNKYYITFIHSHKKICVDVWMRIQTQGSILTTSEAVLEQFIKDNESDIKKYMFGVE